MPDSDNPRSNDKGAPKQSIENQPIQNISASRKIDIDNNLIQKNSISDEVSIENSLIQKIKDLTIDAGETPGMGIGDDAAFLMTSSMEHEKFIVATDSIVENVHFNRKWCSWADVACKLFEVNSSDLLVKGAKPTWALLTMNIQPSFAKDHVQHDEFLKSLGDNLRKRGIALIGGDITRSDTNTFTLTLMANSHTFIPRHNNEIKEGDLLAIKGIVGASDFALAKLKNEEGISENLSLFYRQPKAIWDNEWLIKSNALASMDQSDSLIDTLQTLCSDNKISMRIDLDALPTLPEILSLPSDDRYSLLLNAAEDFAQLAIFPANRADELNNAEGVHVIGHVTGFTERPGKKSLTFCKSDGSTIQPSIGSHWFEHF